MLDFLANNWPYLIILVVVVALFFVIRGALKGLKARSPFNMENIRKSTEPNFLALQQKSKALLADADMICEIKPGSDQVIPKKEDVKFFRRAVSGINAHVNDHHGVDALCLVNIEVVVFLRHDDEAVVAVFHHFGVADGLVAHDSDGLLPIVVDHTLLDVIGRIRESFRSRSRSG